MNKASQLGFLLVLIAIHFQIATLPDYVFIETKVLALAASIFFIFSGLIIVAVWGGTHDHF